MQPTSTTAQNAARIKKAFMSEIVKLSCRKVTSLRLKVQKTARIIAAGYNESCNNPTDPLLNEAPGRPPQKVAKLLNR